MKTFLYGPGTRVRIRRGRFPMDPSLTGRTGIVVQLDDYRPERYGVTLDGESELREFTEDELEDVGAEPRPAEALGFAGPEVGPTPSGGSGGRH